ncbi:MAG: 5'/3'-nucleotidase SurE [Myxococcales bacterium]|nr:5'/3'-nucleotidase SurE [Myxococcales bacterium]
MKPLILVTNDDGYRAPGILALAEALESIADVLVVAPESQRSAVGHQITLHKPIRLWERQPNRWVCSGSPVDCVYLAVQSICADGRKPDLVVSGINRGANLGNDVFYSGTVAGAMEGLLTGFRAMAVSQLLTTSSEFNYTTSGEVDYSKAAQLTSQIALQFLNDGLPRDVLLNLNVPPNYDPALGVRACRLGRRIYDQGAVKRLDPRGREYFWIGGSQAGFEEIPDSDCVLVHQGYATLTPVHADMTDHESLDIVSTWDLARRAEK